MPRNLITAVLVVLAPLGVLASVEDDPTSLSYISYLERYATIQPASDEATIEAAINMPLVTGDRIDSAREARVEVVLADGSYLWMDEYTSVSLDAVALSRDVRGDRTVVFLADGTIMVELLPGLERTERTRIDGGSDTVYLEEAGLYRVEILPDGGLWVEVWDGLVEATTPVGGVVLRPGSGSQLREGQISGVQARLTDGDDFARWVESRRQAGLGESAQHVDARYGRSASQLDSYGTWIYLESSDTWAWRPTVAVDWRPYNAGRWYWTSTGWSWQSYEPWGWLPYHYGSWWHSSAHGWVWGWGRTWSPAWVHWSYAPGWIGWCPTGWYSSWWWGSGWGWGSHHHHGDHYRPGGGYGYDRPPRGDVVPGRSRSSRPVPAGDLMLDIEGRARRSSVRGDAWSVVSERDFASPRVGRLVRPGSESFPAGDGGSGTVVVTSKPLRTARPGRAAPSEEFGRVFRDVERRAPTDVTRVLARDRDLTRDEALATVTPESGGRMAGRSAAAPSAEEGGGTESRTPRRSSIPSITGSERPTDRSRSIDRGTSRNYYRPPSRSRPTESGSSGSAAKPGSESGTVSRSGRPGRAPSSEQALPPTSGSRSPATGRSAPTSGTVRRPSSNSSNSRGTVRPVTPPLRPGSSIRSPIVVPRAPSSSGRSGTVNRGSSTRRPSSATSPRSSGSSTRSSGSTSRSSGSRAAPSRSSSSGSRSSGRRSSPPPSSSGSAKKR